MNMIGESNGIYWWNERTNHIQRNLLISNNNCLGYQNLQNYLKYINYSKYSVSSLYE